jgi:hypothetical protein
MWQLSRLRYIAVGDHRSRKSNELPRVRLLRLGPTNVTEGGALKEGTCRPAFVKESTDRGSATRRCLEDPLSHGLPPTQVFNLWPRPFVFTGKNDAE